MKDKQIMINGINVSKCVHRQWDNSQKTHLCCSSNTPLTSGNCCEENPNCYFKQLARKTGECEKSSKRWRKLRNV